MFPRRTVLLAPSPAQPHRVTPPGATTGPARGMSGFWTRKINFVQAKHLRETIEENKPAYDLRSSRGTQKLPRVSKRFPIHYFPDIPEIKKQIDAGTLVSSQGRRALLVQRLNRGSTALFFLLHQLAYDLFCSCLQ